MRCTGISFCKESYAVAAEICYNENIEIFRIFIKNSYAIIKDSFSVKDALSQLSRSLSGFEVGCFCCRFNQPELLIESTKTSAFSLLKVGKQCLNSSLGTAGKVTVMHFVPSRKKAIIRLRVKYALNFT